MTLAASVAVRLDVDVKELTSEAHVARVIASSLGNGEIRERHLARSKLCARAAAELRGVARDLGASSETTVTWPVGRVG